MQSQIFNRKAFAKVQFRTHMSVLLFCMAIVGCSATRPIAVDSPDTPETLLKIADGELEKGQRDKAIATLNQAAKEYPTSILPWLRLGNVWFETGNYPSAILAANEVLQRDPANQEAKSMLVVAGLRVAASAVAGLRPSAQVGTNARLEAENLTNSLREALGEKVLVPQPAIAAETKPSSSASRLKTRISKSLPSTRTTSSSNIGTSGGGDPFKSLK